tara:strand:- start:7886 stop:8314 length:429 start_codon:yes stop_codon:yes gene_type:complete
MKQLFVFFLSILFTCNMNQPDAISEIKSVLEKQQNAWNTGDIEGFMQGYWQSEELVFESENGIAKGWKNTLARYKKVYPNKKRMGSLVFKILDVKLKNDSIATLKGKWEVIRKNDTPKGGFLLTFNKIKCQWLIVKDYTTSE